MTSKEFRDEIYVKRPRYDAEKMDIIKNLARKGSRSSRFLQFGPTYEIYMYAFFIGYNLKERLPFAKKADKEPFRDFGYWRPEGLINYILMLLFSDNDVVKYSWEQLEELDETELKEIVSNIIQAIEEYANAGMNYLKDKKDTAWEEFKDPFVFVNLLSEVVDEDKIKDNYLLNSTKKPVVEDKNIIRIRELVEIGETTTVEFKSTFRYCLKQKQVDKKIAHSCMKTIAAFLNTDGGTLLIGVQDDKNILGLEYDFNSFNKADKKDEFQKYLDNQIENYLGNSVFDFLKFNFHIIDDKMIYEIQVSPSSTFAILKNGENEEFYIRRSASSKALSLREALAYMNSHWKK